MATSSSKPILHGFKACVLMIVRHAHRFCHLSHPRDRLCCTHTLTMLGPSELRW